MSLNKIKELIDKIKNLEYKLTTRPMTKRDIDDQIIYEQKVTHYDGQAGLTNVLNTLEDIEHSLNPEEGDPCLVSLLVDPSLIVADSVYIKLVTRSEYPDAWTDYPEDEVYLLVRASVLESDDQFESRKKLFEKDRLLWEEELSVLKTELKDLVKGL